MASEPTEEESGLESFFNNILKPGSSLDPTFLAIVDGAFASLLGILLLSFFATSWNLHILSLIVIVICLWGSVKWYEIHNY
ncbi:hypothetical protein FA15DRAFT_587068 [Coprinopsis marcescibilis]|uniref:Uncharacterized protein n=1 Tax=Coprinopsis marcescibilis TaxID=230819 RepID=A0A5C3L2X2_COPMA|nr:hypothetical protein FA15DRAFT_587068 [Coprinopsis marcescibilis]